MPRTKVQNVSITKISRCRWRDEDDSPEKIRVAKERIARQGFRGHLDGRQLPDGAVEQLTGHNRVAACKELGIKTIPFVIKNYTDEEALDIFLSDNMKEDGQGTGWALGAVRKVMDYHQKEGKTAEESRYYLAKAIGVEATGIVRLSEMNTAIDKGDLTAQVKRILLPDNAVEYWRKLKELRGYRDVPLSEQNAQIENIVASKDTRGKIRILFCEALKEMRPPKTATRIPLPANIIAENMFDKLISFLTKNMSDFEEEDVKSLSKKLDYICTLFPVEEENESSIS
jgi:hypothetical protein